MLNAIIWRRTKFVCVESFQIIEMVAADSEDKGMFEDSVKLYDLAGNHEKVVELLSKLLAQVRTFAGHSRFVCQGAL